MSKKVSSVTQTEAQVWEAFCNQPYDPEKAKEWRAWFRRRLEGCMVNRNDAYDAIDLNGLEDDVLDQLQAVHHAAKEAPTDIERPKCPCGAWYWDEHTMACAIRVSAVATAPAVTEEDWQARALKAEANLEAVNRQAHENIVREATIKRNPNWWGHSGPCQPGCTCVVATTRPDRNKDG